MLAEPNFSAPPDPRMGPSTTMVGDICCVLKQVVRPCIVASGPGIEGADGRIRTGARVRRPEGRDGFASNENLRESLLPARASSRRLRFAGTGKRPLSGLSRPPDAGAHPGRARSADSSLQVRPDHDPGRQRHLRRAACDRHAPVHQHRHHEREEQLHGELFSEAELCGARGPLQPTRDRRGLQLHDSRAREHVDLHRDARGDL